MTLVDFVYIARFKPPYWVEVKGSDGSTVEVVIGDVNAQGGRCACCSDYREVLRYRKHADSSWLHPE